jgi:polar amino acid transport system permease protein
MAMSVSQTTADEPAVGTPLRARPARRPGRWIASAVVLVVVATFGHTLVVNPNFEWPVVGHYFGSSLVLTGLLRTLEVTGISMLLGIVLGTVIAVMRLSSTPIVATAGWAYVWIFRSVPLLVQLLVWYNLAALYPRLSIGIPFGPAFAHVDANHAITPFVAAVLGLGLHEAAYMAEIVRAGILGVDRGQTEAAEALGMHRMLILRRIVLPQALRLIIPPTGNETISTLKGSSLVSVLSMADLLYSVQIVYSRTFQTIPLLLVACLWYLAVTSVLGIGQYYLERHVGRGSGRPGGAGGRRGPLLSLLRMRPSRRAVSYVAGP